MRLLCRSPDAEATYRVRFLFDPNSVSITSDRHVIFRAFGSTGQDMLKVELGNAPSGYRISVQTRKDNGQWLASTSYTISDGVHTIELEWRAATAAGANDGVLRLWIDGTSMYEYSALDNDTWRIESARLGYPNPASDQISGTICLDYFESRTLNYMDPVAGATGCSAVKREMTRLDAELRRRGLSGDRYQRSHRIYVRRSLISSCNTIFALWPASFLAIILLLILDHICGRRSHFKLN